MEQGKPTALIQNNSVLLYNDEQDLEISARYHMPMCMYYHCDFVYQSDAPARTAMETAQNFREKHGYNFNREDQLIQAAACALHQQVRVKDDQNGITISTFSRATDFPLYDEDVNTSLGVRVVFSENIDIEQIRVDADVWYWDDQTLVLGLNRPVSISKGSAQPVEPHLRRVNMAADIKRTETGAVVQFLSGGMMEVSVAGDATTDSPDWQIIKRDHETIFVKYGSQESLNLIF